MNIGRQEWSLLCPDSGLSETLGASDVPERPRGNGTPFKTTPCRSSQVVVKSPPGFESWPIRSLQSLGKLSDKELKEDRKKRWWWGTVGDIAKSSCLKITVVI